MSKWLNGHEVTDIHGHWLVLLSKSLSDEVFSIFNIMLENKKGIDKKVCQRLDRLVFILSYKIRDFFHYVIYLFILEEIDDR